MKVNILAKVFNEQPTTESPSLPHIARIEITIDEPQFNAFDGLKFICKITGSDPQYYDATTIPRISAWFEGSLGDNYARRVEYENSVVEQVLSKECDWYKVFRYDFDANARIVTAQTEAADSILKGMGIDRGNTAPEVDALDMLDLMSNLTRYAIDAHNGGVSNDSDGGNYENQITFPDVGIQLEHVPYPI